MDFDKTSLVTGKLIAFVKLRTPTRTGRHPGAVRGVWNGGQDPVRSCWPPLSSQAARGSHADHHRPHQPKNAPPSILWQCECQETGTFLESWSCPANPGPPKESESKPQCLNLRNDEGKLGTSTSGGAGLPWFLPWPDSNASALQCFTELHRKSQWETWTYFSFLLFRIQFFKDEDIYLILLQRN